MVVSCFGECPEWVDVLAAGEAPQPCPIVGVTELMPIIVAVQDAPYIMTGDLTRVAEGDVGVKDTGYGVEGIDLDFQTVIAVRRKEHRGYIEVGIGFAEGYRD